MQRHTTSQMQGQGPRVEKPRVRCGAAAVEMAIVAPVLFLFIIGIIEFGRVFMVQHVLTNASREGSRRAVIEGASVSEVESLVKNYLEQTSVKGASITVSPDSLKDVGFGDSVTVTVSVSYSDVSWLPAPRFLKETSLSATTVMRAERFQ
jgi:Flp pilus assembly protein TadG